VLRPFLAGFLAFGAFAGLLLTALLFSFLLLPLRFGLLLAPFALPALVDQVVQLGLVFLILPLQAPLVQAQVLQRLGFGYFGLGLEQETLGDRVGVVSTGSPRSRAWA